MKDVVIQSKGKGRHFDYDKAMTDWTLGNSVSEADREEIIYMNSLKI